MSNWNLKIGTEKQIHFFTNLPKNPEKWIFLYSKYKGDEGQQIVMEKIFFSDKGFETNNIIKKKIDEIITDISTLAKFYLITILPILQVLWN